MEYLDKTPDLSADPSTTRVTSPDNGFTSDHGHYGAPPLPLATPPAAYYPDYAYAPHPHIFSPETPASHIYPVGYTQDYAYAPQHIYPPDKYTPYPPSHPRVDPNMPNPHDFADVEQDPTPVPPTQSVLPDALRPSVRPTSTASKQWASTRFSVDSFYAGIMSDNQPSPGQAF
ncbi:hypothetical protein L210DRAFT_3520662 [Boletus edulis BED1]|uniref:Uncharacterized protein n=1 Tax=Boletus edulis BED1 TaxID=1328754 RepID=A0AAD4C641_BOLED|nr:hypothetical protein L210DRAFT_3520662 [Boletus edulis BED1]